MQVATHDSGRRFRKDKTESSILTSYAQNTRKEIKAGTMYKNKYISRALCLLIALSLILMNIPLSHAEDSISNIPGERVGFVTVSVEDSLPVPEGKDWKEPLGQILHPTKIALYENDTMMDCIERACEENDVSIGWSNESKTYINEIAGLKEKEKGGYSGWMGTLNDWFTNLGFKEFSYANGKLKPEM